jgi:hypothetical protein
MNEAEIRGIVFADNLTNAFTGLFLAMREGSIGVGEFIVSQLLAGFAEYLQVKAAAAFAEALIPGPQSGALIAAGVGLSAAAGAARALAASLGLGSRSGSGASVSAGGAGLSPSRGSLNQPPADITLILQGDFDALNPKFVRAVNTATNEGVETIGSGRVRLQTVSGR